jgi:lipoprotein NlpI
MLGDIRPDSLRSLAAAAELDGQAQRCVVSFYLGEGALLRGDQSAAQSLFDETRTTCPKELNEHRAAVAELQRMARSQALTERSDTTGTARPAATR